MTEKAHGHPETSSPARATFTKRPNWLSGSPFSPTVREVYVVLLSYAWMDDGARPPMGRVAQEVGVSRDTVKRSVRELTDAGVISVTARRHGKQQLANGYAFPDLPDDHFTRDADAPQRTSAPTPGASMPPLPGAPTHHEVDRSKEHQEVKNGLDGTTASGGSTRAFGNSQIEKPQEVSRSPGGPKDLGFDHPLVDTVKEQLAVKVVDLLAELKSAKLGKTTDSNRIHHELKTARLLLENDGKSFDEITKMLRWAYDDSYWSTKVKTLFQLRENYPELLRESASRSPRRPNTRSHPGYPGFAREVTDTQRPMVTPMNGLERPLTVKPYGANAIGEGGQTSSDSRARLNASSTRSRS